MTFHKKPPENLEVSRKVSIFADDMKREEVISSIKTLALKTLPPSSTLLLYGSRARGDDHKDSDWDLLILLDKASLSFSVGYPFREQGWEINEEINPQVYSKKEWKDYEFAPFHKMLNLTKLYCYIKSEEYGSKN